MLLNLHQYISDFQLKKCPNFPKCVPFSPKWEKRTVPFSHKISGKVLTKRKNDDINNKHRNLARFKKFLFKKFKILSVNSYTKKFKIIE